MPELVNAQCITCNKIFGYDIKDPYSIFNLPDGFFFNENNVLCDKLGIGIPFGAKALVCEDCAMNRMPSLFP